MTVEEKDRQLYDECLDDVCTLVANNGPWAVIEGIISQCEYEASLDLEDELGKEYTELSVRLKAILAEKDCIGKL